MNSPMTDESMKTRAELGVCARILLGLVRRYQTLVDGRPSPCRFVPTCSSYALDSLDRHGAVRGSWLILRRLGRCHPWGGHGWDPVPGESPFSQRGNA
jgi:putative membrane protein insertion efficiency factor